MNSFSLADRILAIAKSVPKKEWEKLPTDLAEKYREYKIDASDVLSKL